MVLYQPKTPFSEQRDEARADAGRRSWERLKATPGLKVIEEDRAQIAMIDDYLDLATCLDLVWRIDAQNARSKAYSEAGVDDRRTSYSCDFNPHEEFVRNIDHGLADLLGVPASHGETIQGQRYEPGQFFRAHPDFFLVDEPHWAEVSADGGQRTWTTMVFLDEPLAGGATRFIELGFDVTPKTGRLLVWNNLDTYGAPNPNTFHEGTDVVMGRKHIITKWFRERVWA